MRATTADWLADLLTAHTADLAADLESFARRQIPFYAACDGDRVRQALRDYYGALAETVRRGDSMPLRGYLERVVPLLLQEGAPGGDYILLVTHAEERILALIAREAAGTERTGDAQRLARSIGHNTRLIISEVNLQLLIDPARYDEPPARWPPPITTPAA
jgi:hypothetical protein